jgi:hypothetical protein
MHGVHLPCDTLRLGCAGAQRRCRLPTQEGLTKQYAQMVPSLAALARSMVRDLDPQVGVQEGCGLRRWQACEPPAHHRLPGWP